MSARPGFLEVVFCEAERLRDGVDRTWQRFRQGPGIDPFRSLHVSLYEVPQLFRTEMVIERFPADGHWNRIFLEWHAEVEVFAMVFNIDKVLRRHRYFLALKA
ncbi:hypothetical protein [Variovorax sp. dw_954]|uniref:hypothetical protein n=1 Tax=Variovorax sp. dw_954 TaxID=2720078 RepID=UPI001BD1FFF9|nr:hypothetical protein [Variovorax sp. dw_954]